MANQPHDTYEFGDVFLCMVGALGGIVIGLHKQGLINGRGFAQALRSPANCSTPAADQLLDFLRKGIVAAIDQSEEGLRVIHGGKSHTSSRTPENDRA